MSPFKTLIDTAIIRTVFGLLILKLMLSYLNVKLTWWQRHLVPNIKKFNPLNLPDGVTRYLEYLMIPLLVWYIYRNWKHIGSLRIPIFIGISFLLLNIGTSLHNDVFIFDSIEYTFKIMAPVLFFVCLITHFNIYRFNFKKYFHITLVVCVVCTVVALLYFNRSYNHWQQWLPIYFASLHTHTYVLVCVAVGFAYFFINRKWFVLLIIYLAIVLWFLYSGYQIRSSLVFYGVFLIGVMAVLHDEFKLLTIRIAFLAPLMLALFLIINSSFNLNEFSSGRMTMYKAKYEMLKEYSFTDFVFGRGKGADYITTSDWWYEEKNSHNDYLTLLVENGLPYLLLFLGLLFFLIIYPNKIKITYVALIVGFAVTSLLSNGITLRPIAGYVFFMVLAYVYLNKSIESNERELKQMHTTPQFER